MSENEKLDLILKEIKTLKSKLSEVMNYVGDTNDRVYAMTTKKEEDDS